MKKSFLLLAFISAIFIQDGFSQFQFGIRGGITQSSINDFMEFASQDLGEITADLKGGRTGFLVGVVTRVKLGPVFLQPELYFANDKYAYYVEGSQIDDDAYEEKNMSLNLPVMVGMKFGPVRINAGPEAHVNVKKTSDLADFDFYKDSLKTFTVGWTGGAGLDLMGVMLDVRYSGNLSKLGSDVEIGNETFEFDDNPGRWSFTVGFFL